MRVVKAGRVKLIEFHVGHPTAGTPGHGNTVASGAVRIAGVQVDLAGPASG